MGKDQPDTISSTIARTFEPPVPNPKKAVLSSETAVADEPVDDDIPDSSDEIILDNPNNQTLEDIEAACENPRDDFLKAVTNESSDVDDNDDENCKQANSDDDNESEISAESPIRLSVALNQLTRSLRIVSMGSKAIVLLLQPHSTRIYLPECRYTVYGHLSHIRALIIEQSANNLLKSCKCLVGFVACPFRLLIPRDFRSVRFVTRKLLDRSSIMCTTAIYSCTGKQPFSNTSRSIRFARLKRKSAQTVRQNPDEPCVCQFRNAKDHDQHICGQHSYSNPLVMLSFSKLRDTTTRRRQEKYSIFTLLGSHGIPSTPFRDAH